nr:T-cell immunomodulatory protein-like [Equus asinus]
MAAAGRLPSSWVLLAPLLGGLALPGVGPVPARALHNVTAELFGAEAWGTLAAFGDLNSDKQTDLFVLRERNDLIVFLADQNAPYFKPKVKVSLKIHTRTKQGFLLVGHLFCRRETDTKQNA